MEAYQISYCAHLRELGHRFPVGRTDAIAAARVSALANPLLRAAMVKLAAIRFTSYSNGPWERLVEVVQVEEQSPLGVKRKRRSWTGWASPHNWAASPATGVSARSAAMIFAAPR